MNKVSGARRKQNTIIYYIIHSADYGIFSLPNPSFNFDVTRQYDVSITCSDAAGGSDSGSYYVNIQKNSPPIIRNLPGFYLKNHKCLLLSIVIVMVFSRFRKPAWIILWTFKVKKCYSNHRVSQSCSFYFDSWHHIGCFGRPCWWCCVYCRDTWRRNRYTDVYTKSRERSVSNTEL